jgi:hypothetical protein
VILMLAAMAVAVVAAPGAPARTTRERTHTIRVERPGGFSLADALLGAAIAGGVVALVALVALHVTSPRGPTRRPS